MKRSIRTWVIVPLLAASLAVARAQSFYGDDWLFSFNGTLIITGYINTTTPINVSNQSITITQTSPTNIQFPLDLSTWWISVTVPLTYTAGSPGIVQGSASTSIIIPAGTIGSNFDLRLDNVLVNIAGNVTGINNAVNEAFGPRVYQIDGIPSPPWWDDPSDPNPPNDTSWGRVGDIYIRDPIVGIWVRIGQGILDVDYWQAIRSDTSANRPPAVPTLIAPAQNARVSSLPTFQLRASDPDGDRVRFEVQVWQGSDVRTFSVPASGYVASDQVASGTPPQPLPAGTWRWKARTRDLRGGVSSWSGERVFVVVDIQSSPTPPTPAGAPNVAWGPLVRVSPRPNGWDSDTKRLVAGKRVNNVLYLAFSHDRRLSDALTFSYNSGRVEVRLTQQGVYWVPANSISSLTQISDPLEIPAYVVVKRRGSDPAICYGINACNLLGNDVEEFYAICLRVMLSNGERVPPNQTTVMDYLKAIGQSNQIPPHLLWAIAWEETHPEFRWSHVQRDGWSLLTFDGGIGMMQLTQGSAVWGPRYIGGRWLDNRVIPNDLLTHLYKLAADWQYNVRAGAALLNLPAGRVLGPPDGTLVRPVLEHWWFRVWRYNGISCDDDTNGWRCNLGPFSYPERIRFWLSRTPCETPPYPRVADSMELIGIPTFMQYGSCNAGISFAPTPYPANIDIDFDGTIDARIKGVSSPSNLWDNNGELYFQVESLSSVSVQEVRVLNAEAREQYRQAGGGTIRCCAGLQSGYIVVRLNNTDVKTYFSRSQQFIWRTPGDVNGDGCVDDADLLAVLFAFGCSTGCGVEDINGDGVVDDADLLEVLFHFGSGC
jgi:hypothetical protein